MQISQNQHQILVYNSEIWPKNQMAYTKSKCIGFRNYIQYSSDYWCDILTPEGL